MSDSHLYVIIFDELTSDRRQVVQELVKEKGNKWWWHNFPNVWVVGGRDAEFWRDTMRPIISGTSSAVLVLRLAEDPGDRWTAFGPESEKSFGWFHRAFKALDSP